MSKIGRKPIPIPGGVTVTVQGSRVQGKGPKGELALTIPGTVQAAVKNGTVVLTSSGGTAREKSLHGLARNLVANMVLGVSQGFTKQLELQGVGFRATLQGPKLTLALGFSAPVEFPAPAGIQIAVKESVITISGADRQLVGDVAARIRGLYPPEPYKGKGVRYLGEHVRRKAGKTVA